MRPPISTSRQLALFSKRLLLLSMRIVAPAAIAVAIVAPYVMGLFGQDYAAEGTTLLRLLAVGAIPYSVIPVYISVVRVQRRVRRAAAVLAVMCFLVLMLSELFLRSWGLLGVGVAWLVTQTALGGYLLLFQLRPLWSSAPDKSSGDPRGPAPTLGVIHGD